jgi:SnoaL-like polyketide cyclase
MIRQSARRFGLGVGFEVPGRRHNRGALVPLDDNYFCRRRASEGAQPSVLGAFPDGRWVIEDMVAEGDRVAWRYSFYGTHHGEFMGLPATGKQLRVSGILISRIAADRIAEEWEIFDAATMFRELGQK